jgi:uncharacterized membrane protein
MPTDNDLPIKTSAGKDPLKNPADTPAERPSLIILEKMEQIERKFEAFRGPIPPPQILADYEKILPGSTERIITMAEKQSAHRQSLEMIAVKSGANDSRLGLIFGLIIGLAALCLAGFCSYIGSPIVGGLIGFGGLTGLVSVFVIGKKMNREERENKARFVAEKEKNQNEPSERK